MSPKPPREIIEVFEIDPVADADPLAMVPGRHTTLRMPASDGGGGKGVALDAPLRPWWIVPAALVAIAAVFVVVAVASGSDGPSRTTISIASTTTSVGDAPVAAVLPATPDGYTVTAVQRRTTSTPPDHRLTTELFATQVDSAERSAWLQVTAGPAGDWYVGTGVSRVSVPWGVALFGNRSDGALTLSGPIAGGAAVITSSGVSMEDVHEIFAGLRFEAGRLQIFDRRLGTTFQPVAADDASGGSTPGPAAVVAVTYGRVRGAGGSTPDGSITAPDAEPNDSFTVTTGPVQPPAREVTRRFFLSHPATFELAGQELVVGADTREPGVTSVVLERAGRQVTVAGTAPRAVIVKAASTMHTADSADVDRLAGNVIAAPAEDPAATSSVVLATGQLDGGRPWNLDAAMSCSGPEQPAPHCVMRRLVIGGGGGPAEVPITPQTAGITIAATPQLTAVVAFVPTNLVGATMVVTVNGQARTVEPIAVDGADLVAADAFDTMAPFTIEIRAGGRAIASASG